MRKSAVSATWANRTIQASSSASTPSPTPKGRDNGAQQIIIKCIIDLAILTCKMILRTFRKVCIYLSAKAANGHPPQPAVETKVPLKLSAISVMENMVKKECAYH